MQKLKIFKSVNNLLCVHLCQDDLTNLESHFKLSNINVFRLTHKAVPTSNEIKNSKCIFWFIKLKRMVFAKELTHNSHIFNLFL